MNIVLIGYRGSGKTTVGRLLGERLGRNFVDCDDLIVAEAGKPIRAIFADHGEELFRELETRGIQKIGKLRNHVVALGGGALGREENRRLLKQSASHVIFLRCEPAELLRRIESDAGTTDNRPNLTSLGGGIHEITLLLGQREPIYASAKTAELDVTHLTPQQAVERIEKML
jgi:shikimate kinase